MPSVRIFAHARRIAGVAIASFVGLALLAPAASAQALNFHFHFAGTMSCQSPIPVANAPVSGDGAGTLNPDGSVAAEIPSRCWSSRPRCISTPDSVPA